MSSVIVLTLLFNLIAGNINVSSAQNVTDAANSTSVITTPGFNETTEIEVEDNVIIGRTLVTLSVANCYQQECTLGNFVTDAMVYAFRDEEDTETWTYSSVAVVNPEVLKGDLLLGDIYLNDLTTSLPTNDVLIVGEIEGKNIKEIFEYNSTATKMLQVSGIKVVYDFTRPEGDRVQSLRIRCQNCTIPVYEYLEVSQTYRIITISSLVNDTQNYTLFSKYINVIEEGPITIETFKIYLAHQSPIFKEENGRITIYKDNYDGHVSGSGRLLPSFVVLAVLYFVNCINK